MLNGRDSIAWGLGRGMVWTMSESSTPPPRALHRKQIAALFGVVSHDQDTRPIAVSRGQKCVFDSLSWMLTLAMAGSLGAWVLRQDVDRKILLQGREMRDFAPKTQPPKDLVIPARKGVHEMGGNRHASPASRE